MHFFVYRTLNTNKNKVQELPTRGRKVLDIRSPESNSDDLQMPEKQTTPRGPKQDPPGRLSGYFRIASHKVNPSELWSIVDSYFTIAWVTWEAVTVVEGTP